MAMSFVSLTNQESDGMLAFPPKPHPTAETDRVTQTALDALPTPGTYPNPDAVPGIPLLVNPASHTGNPNAPHRSYTNCRFDVLQDPLLGKFVVWKGSLATPHLLGYPTEIQGVRCSLCRIARKESSIVEDALKILKDAVASVAKAAFDLLKITLDLLEEHRETLLTFAKIAFGASLISFASHIPHNLGSVPGLVASVFAHNLALVLAVAKVALCIKATMYGFSLLSSESANNPHRMYSV